MKIIIYGKGRLFQRYKEKLDWNEIVAIADKGAVKNEVIQNKPIILPQDIQRLQYDYIVIFSNRLFYDIRRDLIGEYYINPAKIVSWSFLINDVHETDIFMSIKTFIKELNIKMMLDTDMSIIPKHIFTLQELASDINVEMDGIGRQNNLSSRMIYRKIYGSFNDIHDFYDLIYVNNACVFDEHNLREKLRNKYKYILIRISYADYSEGKIAKLEEYFNKYADVKKFYMADSIYFLLQNEHKRDKKIDAHIFVITHRKYNVLHNDLYYPICVGRNYQEQEFLSEQNGQNISHLNEKLNECTAMYWIWKNTSCEYVGISHYRRYFYNNGILSEGNYLDREELSRIFQEYDIILPQYMVSQNRTVKEHLRLSINEDAYESGYKAIRKAMENHQPEYLGAFDEVMQGHKLFICNMFVTYHTIFNRYCEWLFSFLIEAAESVDVDRYDNYSKRVVGFFAERMLTVWLLKQNLKIKELPIDLLS